MGAAPGGDGLTALRPENGKSRLDSEGASSGGVAGAFRAEKLRGDCLAVRDYPPGAVGFVEAVRAGYLGDIVRSLAVVIAGQSRPSISEFIW